MSGSACQQPVQPVPQQGPGRVVVVSEQFCMPQKTKLVMQAPESFGANRNSEDYHITDASGRTYFLLKSATASGILSTGGKRQLFDAYSKPLIDVEQKMMTLHGTWMLKRSSDGVRLAEVKSKRSGLFKTVITVFLNDGDKDPDYVITGNKSFTIKECRNNTVIAKLRKGRALACLSKPATAGEAQRYSLKIHPGVDAAFVTALAMCCEEMKGKKAR